MIEISIIDAAFQRFSMTLDNRRVTMQLRYNTSNERWSFDFALDDQWLMTGKRIVTNVNLLRPFPHLDIGMLFAAAVTPGGVPDRKGLPGGLVRLYHITEAELAAL